MKVLPWGIILPEGKGMIELSCNRQGTPSQVRCTLCAYRSLPQVLVSVVLWGMLLYPGSPAWAQTGYQKKAAPTPVPTINRSANIQREREAIYEGYARLFVLGHVVVRIFGIEGVMPPSINLDFLANQPFLAETGDVFVYRASPRIDVMWPLILPTPPDETPTPLATETPLTPEKNTVVQSTPTPTPTVTPTDVVPPPLKIQALSHTSQGSVVMISDIMLAVGDTIGGATVTEIQKRFVKIEYFGKVFIVTSKGTVRAAEFKEEDLSLE
jgi:hypothetical protein